MEAKGGIEMCKHEWNKRKCPFCRVDELEAKLERQREIAELLLKPDLRVDDVWTFQERWAALEEDHD